MTIRSFRTLAALFALVVLAGLFPAGSPATAQASEFTVSGRGWGHGVGLCQFGAYGMALAGRSHERILSHYYPGAELADLATIRLPDAPR